jgi:hypothetical protein
MRPTKRNKRKGSREADCIPSKACLEPAIQSVVKVLTQRKSKQKRTIKRKKKGAVDGDIVDPVMPYAGVSGGCEDEISCQGDTGGPTFDQEITRSEW